MLYIKSICLNGDLCRQLDLFQVHTREAVPAALPYNSEVTLYIYDPSTSGYVAAATVDGLSNASGRSGAFYLLSVS